VNCQLLEGETKLATNLDYFHSRGCPFSVGVMDEPVSLESIDAAVRRLSQQGPVYGRIQTGKDESWFSHIGAKWRKAVFVMDGPSILELWKRYQNGYDMVMTLGFTPDLIKQRITVEKKYFAFQLFVSSEELPVFPCTWDGIMSMIKITDPDIHVDLLVHLEALKTTPFEEIEQLMHSEEEYNGVTSFAHLDRLNKDPRWMSRERFRSLPNKDLLASRLYLYCTERLLELFKGDGYTYDTEGNKGVPEFIVLNQECANLGESYQYVPLAIALPETN
jgi:hypothetical protein